MKLKNPVKQKCLFLILSVLFTLISSQIIFAEDESGDGPLAQIEAKIENLNQKVDSLASNQKTTLEKLDKIIEELDVLKIRIHRS